MKYNTLTFTEHARQCQGQGKPSHPVRGREVTTVVHSVKVETGWVSQVGLHTASNNAGPIASL